MPGRLLCPTAPEALAGVGTEVQRTSTAQYVFLIMQDDLHFDDEAIATALNVKRTSVRSMRSRIKGREK